MEETYFLSPRVDATNAKAVQADLEALVADGVTDLTLDFAENKYVSSAGLRAVLSTQKKLTKAGGSMRLINVPDSVKEIFDVTGYSRFLNIEN